MKKNNQNLKKIITQKKTIHQLFEEQVEKTPNNIAVVYEDKQLTYKELNEKANQLAHHLIEQDVKADDLIAICVECSLEMIIGLLAILKAGGAYVPIDPNYPSDRIEYMVTNSNAKILLTQKPIKNNLPKTNGISICIDTFDASNHKKTNTNTNTNTKSDNLAYVIYTSGSTGKPKGVMVEHGNVNRVFQATFEEFHFNNKDVWTLFHSFAFDFAVWEIWGALLHGAKLIIVPFNTSRSPDDFYKLIIKEKVTILNQTPSAFKQLINVDIKNNIKVSTLRIIILGGEKLDFKSLSLWLKKYSDLSPKLINIYGPTETTIFSTYYKISKNDIKNNLSIIGNMLNDLASYILDKNNLLLPKGVVGELHISGDGLARGYLHQPELTKEKFINNPFIKNERMYKTGDLVRYLENGNIEYIGRIDDQVKIRGFRIELGEIEQQLLSIEQIKESVVIAKEDPNGYKLLVGYIILNEKIDLESIKLKLSKHLPDYMIPNAIVTIETIPLTPNGKIDKKALAKLDVNIESSYQYVAPRDAVEEQLTNIFSEVLNIDKIGIYDDFFELGGNSLSSIILISKINNLLNLSLPLAVLFKASTVRELIYIIDAKEQDSILIEIQTKGFNVPIFAVPGGAGSSVIYKKLSYELGKTQPFYGLDIIPNRNCNAKFATAKETAKANILAIKSIQPNGPYRLIGFCGGGVIVLEMAKLLRKEVDSIILLNAYPSKKNKTIFELKNIIIEIIKYKIKCKILCFKNKFFFNFANKFIVRYSKIVSARYHRMCYEWFTPEPINERFNISLFSVNKNTSKQKWANLIKYDITEIKIDGDNETLLNQTNAPSLSKKINSYYESLNKKV